MVGVAVDGEAVVQCHQGVCWGSTVADVHRAQHQIAKTNQRPTSTGTTNISCNRREKRSNPMSQVPHHMSVRALRRFALCWEKMAEKQGLAEQALIRPFFICFQNRTL